MGTIHLYNMSNRYPAHPVPKSSFIREPEYCSDIIIGDDVWYVCICEWDALNYLAA